MKKYYSVDEIAGLLNIHPKTIQRYIREGRLKATKLGKAWRVTGHDLSVFAEGPGASAEKEAEAGAKNKVSVSAVIDIDAADRDDAMRMVNMLTAALNSKPLEYGRSTMSAQFLEPESKVRVMLWGSIEFMETMIHSISVMTGRNE